MGSARRHHEAGRGAEAAQLVEAVLRIDGDYAGAGDLGLALESDSQYVFDQPLLGSNFARRVPVERSLAARILLYPVDRFLDLFDLLSFDGHVGIGLYGSLHLTRAFQVTAGARGTGGLGWHDQRSLGILSQAESGFTVIGLGAESYAGSLVGTSGVRASADAMAGLHRPSLRLYQQLRDYWAVGFAATLGVAGVELDLHPVELADFFAGWFGVDFLHDDFAHTRGLALERRDRELLRILNEFERSPETLAGYDSSTGAAPGPAE
jgi:hypothetical protein